MIGNYTQAGWRNASIVTDVYHINEVMRLLVADNGTWVHPQVSKVFVSAFFGFPPERVEPQFKGTTPKQRILGNTQQYLTPFPFPWNTFQGIVINQSRLAECRAAKLETLSATHELHGIAWGKEARYFNGTTSTGSCTTRPSSWG